jgi:prepilin signal peptidase PulO-like enzyme (type II secretory pathway)
MCPDCRHILAWYDLVPLFSWLWLGGKCRYCKKPISTQYPIVEALMAILFIWSYLVWNFSASLSYLLFGTWLLLVVALVILAVYDLKWMILPDKVMLAILVLAVIKIILASIQSGSWHTLLGYLVAALLGGGFFYALYALGKGKWMGGGDVKLVFCMGLILGLKGLGVALVLGFTSAAVISVLLIVLHKASRKSLIPFGPFLIAATFFAQLYGEQIFRAYLHLATIY